jgi:DNA-binding CsgD family transcriptional regulator
MGLYAFASLLVSNTADVGAGRALASSAATALPSLAVLLVAVLRFEKLEIKTLYCASLPCMSFALALSLMGFDNRTGIVGLFTSTLAFSCFSTFMYMLLFRVSFRYDADPLWLFGFSRAARVAVSLVAQGVAAAGAWETLEGVSALLVLTALVATSSLVAMGKRFETTWGVRTLPDKEDSQSAAAQDGDRHADASTASERCARVAYLFGLTHREEEVLLILANGGSVADIERELVISNNTARVHVRHVYRKLDVHSREEAVAVVWM